MNRQRIIAIVIGLLFFSCFSIAQNIVPNWSFEDTISCPTSSNELYKTKFWFNPTWGTPDYFNGCSLSMTVPDAPYGFQNAKTGKAYVGLYIYSFFNSDTREYIETSLTTPLKSGRKYCIEFNASLPEKMKYAANKLGAYLSTDSLISNNPFYFSIISSIYEISIIKDTLNWVKITGEYKASGGEKFITIGNFFTDIQTSYILVNNNSTEPYAYYYIDDVSVYEIEELPIGLAGRDTVICEDQTDSLEIGMPQISGYQYTWKKTAGLTDTTIAQAKVKPLQTTTYILTIIDTTPKPYTCMPTLVDSMTISIINCDTIEPPAPKENNSFLPNIFSPNDDGNNDVFRVRGENISEIYLVIYNRWGEKIFETTDKAKEWDGTFNRAPQPAGVFVYYLKVSYEDGKTEELKGNVTLIR